LQHHPGKKPKETSNAVFSLVVGRNSDVHIPHGRVSVTESNGGNVSKSSFLNGLQTNPYILKSQSRYHSGNTQVKKHTKQN